MSKFKFPESIKSRPVYGELAPRKGKEHLFIADAEGAEAIMDVSRCYWHDYWHVNDSQF